ncbi:MAG TPA: thioredoxin domain-containing protein [Candidatus Limnocylindrales bacterium]|nr:thioredoxin domain-containing protein [Candidatus Limnocylindrales bacterium]
MRRWCLIAVCVVLWAAPQCRAQAASSGAGGQDQIIGSAEAFIRNLFTWGPEYNLKLGPLAPSPAAGFYTLPIEVTINGQSEKGTFYVSKDGKTFIRGEMFDMAADPFAAARAKLHIEGNPSKGPADARVTIVEFSDFECPHCREVHTLLHSVEEHYPEVRVVYKDFPLTQIHPWAETAAIGGRCAYDQSPAAFWKVHDLIFDNQDVLSADNIWDQLVNFAGQTGLDTNAFKVCMASPDAKKAVDENRDQGLALNVNSTPTLFINGRTLAGGDLKTIEQFIDFELHRK